MATERGRTPAATDLRDKWIELLYTWPAKRADTSSDRPGRQMNRNATWPAEKGGHQGDKQWQRWETNDATWPAKKGGHQQWDLGDKWIEMLMANGKGRTPAVTDLGDKWIEIVHGQWKRADTSRQMNRNATWPAEKGGHQQQQTWETNE